MSDGQYVLGVFFFHQKSGNSFFVGVFFKKYKQKKRHQLELVASLDCIWLLKFLFYVLLLMQLFDGVEW